jgi:MFS family permease
LVFTLGYVLDADGASSRDVALVFGVYTVSYALIAPVLGRASDADGRRRSVVVGAGLFLLASLALAAVFELDASGGDLAVRLRVPGSPRGWAYGAVALFALSNAFFWPAFQARIGDREGDPEALGRAIRAFNVGWTSGKATGFLAAGVLFQAAPEACFPVAAAAAGLVLACVVVEVGLGSARPGEGSGAEGGDEPSRGAERTLGA